MTTNTKRRITLFVNPSIVKQAKAQAVVEELCLTELVEKALIAYLPNETILSKVNVGVLDKQGGEHIMLGFV